MNYITESVEYSDEEKAKDKRQAEELRNALRTQHFDAAAASILTPEQTAEGEQQLAELESRRKSIFAPLSNTQKTITWLLKGLIHTGSLSYIVGASGSGKSFLAIDLIMALLLQKEKWLNIRIKTQIDKVLYISGEGKEGFRNRIEGYLRQHHIEDFDRANIIINEKAVSDIGNHTTVGEIIEDATNYIDVTKHNLIVVDTQNNALAGDENAAADIKNFQQDLRSIGNALNATIIVIHHEGKNGDETGRGSSVILSDCDNMLAVKNNKGIRNLFAVKTKEGSTTNLQTYFHLLPVTLGYDEDEDAITTCVVEELQENDAKEKQQKQEKELQEQKERNQYAPDKLKLQMIERLLLIKKENFDFADIRAVLHREDPTLYTTPRYCLEFEAARPNIYKVKTSFVKKEYLTESKEKPATYTITKKGKAEFKKMADFLQQLKEQEKEMY